MATFNVPGYFNVLCIPTEGKDPETGCSACGENRRSDYELCRQTYFLKKQSENTKLISETQGNNSNSEAQSLQQENAQLKLQILEQENINNDLKQTQQQYGNNISLLTYGVLGSFIFGVVLTYLILKLRNKPA